MEVVFKVEFFEGIGNATLKIFRKGQLVETLKWAKSGVRTRDLEAGNYNLSFTGVSPPGGTKITIDRPTVPPTPIEYEEGAIADIINMQLRNP